MRPNRSNPSQNRAIALAAARARQSAMSAQLFVGLLFFVFCMVLASAQASTRVAGIVIDNTLSPVGQRFSQAFGSLWHEQGVSKRHVVTVQEDVSARTGNRVTVRSGQTVLFMTGLSRQTTDVYSIAEQAAQRAARQLSAMERAASGDPDLAPDEL